jgi:hypothetical protein
MNKADLKAMGKEFATRRTALDKEERKALDAAADAISKERREQIQAKLTAAGVKGAKVKVEVFYDDFDINEAWHFMHDDVSVFITYKGEQYYTAEDLIRNLRDEAEIKKEEALYAKEAAISNFIYTNSELKQLDAQRQKLVNKLRKQAQKELK